MALSGLHDITQRALEQLSSDARRAGVSFRVTSGYRSIAHQRLLYARRAAGLQRYPVAKPGTSTHNYGLAFDAVSDRQSDLIQLATRLGLVWAGPKDPVHFQIVDQATWSSLLRGAGL